MQLFDSTPTTETSGPAPSGSPARPRVVTLTMNPTIDLACAAAAVRPTHKIRTSDERLDPGGGGINVARVVHELGGDALALIMTGGVTGRLVEELLDTAGIRWRSMPVHGLTRVTVNVHERNSTLEYRFVPEGPLVDEAEWRAALAVLEGVEADWLVASGSLPRGVPCDFYAQAAAIAARRGQRFVLDTSGIALQTALGHGIDVLKLSLGELEFLVGHKLRGIHTQEHEVAALVRTGAARVVVVSLGRDGAILGDRAGIIRLPAMAVEERSAVGAGDCFLAALVMGFAQGFADRDALMFAIATGAAAVATYGTAQLHRADIEARYHALRGAVAAPATMAV